MNKLRIITPLLAAGLAVAGLTPSVSGSTADSRLAAVDICTLRVSATKALNLQHDGKGIDRVRAVLGNTITRDRPYILGQRRNTLGDGQESFSGTATVQLQVERGDPAVFRSIKTRTVRCEERTPTLVFSNGDARYKTRVVIDVLGDDAR